MTNTGGFATLATGVCAALLATGIMYDLRVTIIVSAFGTAVNLCIVIGESR